VVEFFWYSCPHCNAFEPKLECLAEEAAADVVLRRVPVAFRDDFVPQQRLYYTLEAMGKVDELHGKVFNAIHVNRSRPQGRRDPRLRREERLDKAKFQELYNSFSVQTKARKRHPAAGRLQVDGVPALGIAGRYYTDGTLAGNMDRALQVVIT
jgi:thiol:disulfide interchange protein DsbA